MPDTPSEHSKKGTDLHEVTMTLLQDRLANVQHVKATDLEACWEVVNFVDQIKEKAFESEPILLIEQRVELEFIHPLIGFGTLDIALVEPYSHAVLVDGKFGWNHVTPAENNLQIKTYMAGLMQQYELETGEGYILQPFKNRQSRGWWNRTYNDENVLALRKIADDCQAPDAPLRPSEKACQFCRAASVCPALKGHSDALVKESKKPEALAPSELAVWLDAAELAEVRIGAIRAEAYRRLTAGGTIPGWALVDGRRTREWALEDKILIQTLLDAARELEKSPDDVLRTEVASPSQLEQAWGKSKPVKALLEKLIEWKPGKPKLDRVDETKKISS